MTVLTRSTAPTLSSVQPRFATPRTPSRKTYGPAIGKSSALLGRPFMPWQQDAVDVGAEVLDDGRWAFKTVLLVVMRQCGKTTAIEAVVTHRGQMLTEDTLWMTAQNGKKARARWLAMTDRLVRRLPSTFKRNVGVSHEVLRWLKSGCQLQPFAPGGDAEDMHGETPALVWSDEIWVFNRAEWAALQQSYLPGMITKNAQEWLSSTQGTEDSEALNDLIEAGRSLVAEQIADPEKRRGLCYIEYSIPPSVVVGDDEISVEQLSDDMLLDLICAHNPAIGFTQTREALATDLETFTRNGDRLGFIRGYGNHRIGSHRPRVIPAGQWTAARTDLLMPEQVGIGVAVDDNGQHVAVVAAGRLGSGQAVVEVVQAGEGWTLELDGAPVAPAVFVDRLRAKSRVVGVATTTSGSNRDLGDQIEDSMPVGPADYAAACSRFRSGIRELTVLHRDQPSLNAAMRTVDRRKVAGGSGWAGVGASVADAASLALWVADHPVEQTPAEFQVY